MATTQDLVTNLFLWTFYNFPCILYLSQLLEYPEQRKTRSSDEKYLIPEQDFVRYFADGSNQGFSCLRPRLPFIKPPSQYVLRLNKPSRVPPDLISGGLDMRQRKHLPPAPDIDRPKKIWVNKKLFSFSFYIRMVNTFINLSRNGGPVQSILKYTERSYLLP